MIPTFSHPLALLLLPLVPLLLWWWRRRGRGTLRYPSVGLLSRLPGGRSRWAQRGAVILRGLGLLTLVLALAGARWPDRGSRLATDGIALAMVVDVSGSMSNSDFLWDGTQITRLEGMKKIFRLFVEGGTLPDGSQIPGRPQDLVSLVAYAKTPETVCPLTLDHDALLKMLDNVQHPVLDQTSNLGDALAWSLAAVNKAKVKRKVIVVLTDGEDNVYTAAAKPRQAAKLAGNLKIPIYAIDANPETSNDPATVQGRKTLEVIAHLSQGQCFQASGAESLAAVYAQIDQLERSRIESFRYSRYYEGFYWFGLAALTSWLSVVFLESTVWRKLP